VGILNGKPLLIRAKFLSRPSFIPLTPLRSCTTYGQLLSRRQGKQGISPSKRRV
jgi:hypothetical protein